MPPTLRVKAGPTVARKASGARPLCLSDLIACCSHAGLVAVPHARLAYSDPRTLVCAVSSTGITPQSSWFSRSWLRLCSGITRKALLVALG